MLIGFIFTVVIILVLVALASNGNSKEGGEMLGTIVFFFVAGIVFTFLFNLIFEGCSK